MVDNGLREAMLPALIASQVKTAKEAVDLLAKLTDKYGSAEWNTLLFADQKEAWIFEGYGGHTYCAYRMPSDMVAVFGNQCMIGTVDQSDTANYVFSNGKNGSKDLFATIDAAGTAVKEDGKYNIAKSVTESSRDEYSNMRTWEGHRVLAPSTTGISTYNNDYFYSLCFKPDSKVSVLDIMSLYRDRYEGTDYDMSKSENASRRPIATTRSSDVHITQVYSNLPKDSCDLQWLAMGNAEHSVFVPAFSGITDTYSAYKVDGTAYKDSSAYWLFKRNCTLAESDRAYLGQGTKDFWAAQEKSEYATVQKQLAKVTSAYGKSKTNGRAYVTSIAKTAVKNQLNNSNVLYKALLFTSTANNNDRANNARKATFTAPVKFVSQAKKAGFTVKTSGSKYILTKDAAKFTLTLNSTAIYNKDGEYTDDFIYPIYKVNGVVYAPAGFTDSLK